MSIIPYYSKIFLKSAVQYISSVHTVNWKIGKKSRHFPVSLSRVSICVRDVAYLWRWRGAKCYQAQAVPGSESQSASGSGQRGRAGAGASDILSSSSDLIRAVELTSHLESFSTVFIPNVSSFFCFCPQDYM